MAPSIDSAFIEEYEAFVRHLAQQGDNRVRQHVTEVSSGGESYNFDRMGPSEATEKVGKRVSTSDAYADEDWSRRVAQPQTFFHAFTVEHEDKVQMIIDPDSTYAANQAMAMKRQYDDLCIIAATSTALDGEGVPQALPTDQVVGDGTDPISFDMITEIQEVFLGHDIDMDEPKVAIIGPTQIRKLMQLTEQTSADYVRREALQNLQAYGIVPNWMGFTWILSNRLLDGGDVGTVECLFFTKKAIGLAVNMNMMTRITENPEMSYMIQIFAQFTAGAVRIEDEHIVVGHVIDTL